MSTKIPGISRHIVIEGPICAGKTTLALRLAAHFQAGCVLEHPEVNPFLARFYQNPQQYALQTQLYFLIQRAEQLQHILETPQFQEILVSDYLFEKELLFAELTLSEEELKLYREIYARVVLSAHIVPDLIIYLQAKPETLITRIRERKVDIERKITDDYITRLCEQYTRFFHDYSECPVLIVNSEHLNLVENQEDFDLLLRRIETMRSPREYFNKGD